MSIVITNHESLTNHSRRNALMTAHQVQTGTSRNITEQLQMMIPVTHPVLLGLFHLQSLLNLSSFFPLSCLVNDTEN